LNLSSSVLLASIIFGVSESSFIITYIRCCMFGGPFVSFYYKEVARKNEFYFYYNKGISKLNLYVKTLIIYILIGIIIHFLLYYAKLV
jgi:hypothetical protein